MILYVLTTTLSFGRVINTSLLQGALYGQYMVERPGMAKFFLESAKEERGHAIQMMDYLNMRGIKYEKNYTFRSDMVSAF